MKGSDLLHGFTVLRRIVDTHAFGSSRELQVVEAVLTFVSSVLGAFGISDAADDVNK